jgi:hypothetical protein
VVLLRPDSTLKLRRSTLEQLSVEEEEEFLSKVSLDNNSSSNNIKHLVVNNLRNLLSCYRRSQSRKLSVNMGSSARNLSVVTRIRVQ